MVDGWQYEVDRVNFEEIDQLVNEVKTSPDEHKNEAMLARSGVFLSLLDIDRYVLDAALRTRPQLKHMLGMLIGRRYLDGVETNEDIMRRFNTGLAALPEEQAIEIERHKAHLLEHVYFNQSR